MPCKKFESKQEKLIVAKKLRKEMTKHEKKLWHDFLKSSAIKFYRQRIKAGFILDFYCASAKIAIELDGSQHYTQDGFTYDNERTQVLERLGIKVIRFRNSDIDENFEQVCHAIISRVNNFKTPPSAKA